MLLHVLSSSSAGNCYLLKAASGEILILDLGMSLRDIKRALNYDLSNVVGAVVTHRHGDHAKYLAEVARAGITIHTNQDVIDDQYESIRGLLVETNLHQWTLIGGSFEVMPLQAIHDAPCQAFVVRHPEMGTLLFVTDSVTLEYKLKGLNHILIEANYSDALLAEAIEEGRTHPAMRPRLLASHMEISTTIRVLQAQPLEGVQEIALLHLSSEHADPKEFQTIVQKATGIPTYIAGRGLQLELQNPSTQQTI